MKRHSAYSHQEAEWQGSSRSSKIPRTNLYGSKEFIYGHKDKSKWSRLLDQLAAAFQAEQISYILNPAELSRRKTQPVAPPRLVSLFIETAEDTENRKYEQRLLDDDHKALMAKYRSYVEDIPNDFGSAIALVLKTVSEAIKVDLQDWMSKLPSGTAPEGKYNSMRERLEEKWGPSSQRDAIELRDTLSNLDGDAIGWEKYLQRFEEIVSTLTKTLVRDERMQPVFGPAPVLPFFPMSIECMQPHVNQGEINAYFFAARDALNRWVSSPQLGTVLTHAPTEQDRKGILLRALSRSTITEFSRIASFYHLGDNIGKPLDAMWKDVESAMTMQRNAAGDDSRRRMMGGYESLQSSSVRMNQGHRLQPHSRGRSDYAVHHSANQRNHYRSTGNHSSQSNNNAELQPFLDQQQSESFSSSSPNVYDANSVQMPCKNCKGEHFTKECPSVKCHTCGQIFATAPERKNHYITVHGVHQRPQSVKFKESPGKGPSRGSRNGTPRRGDGRVSNQFMQHSIEQEGYESSNQDSVYSCESDANDQSGYDTDDTRNYIFEARVAQVVTTTQVDSESHTEVSIPLPGVEDEYDPLIGSPSSDNGDQPDQMSSNEMADALTKPMPEAAFNICSGYIHEGGSSYVKEASICNDDSEVPISDDDGSSDDAGTYRYEGSTDDGSEEDWLEVGRSSESHDGSAEEQELPELYDGIVTYADDTWVPPRGTDTASGQASDSLGHHYSCNVQQTVSIDPQEWQRTRERDGGRRGMYLDTIDEPYDMPRIYTEEEVATLQSYFLWQGRRTSGWHHELVGPQWTEESNFHLCAVRIHRALTNQGFIYLSGERELRRVELTRRAEESESFNRYRARGGVEDRDHYSRSYINLSPNYKRMSRGHPYREWFDEYMNPDLSEHHSMGECTRFWMWHRHDEYGFPTELYTPYRINMAREAGDLVPERGPAELEDDVLGIVDTGAQVSTIPEFLITNPAWLQSRQPATPGTAIKYGNSDVEEVYTQIKIGDLAFQVTPNRCNVALISVCQMASLGHTVSFTDTSMCIDDETLQYGMRFSKLSTARDWKMPLSAIEQLCKLREAHPRGRAPHSSRPISRPEV